MDNFIAYLIYIGFSIVIIYFIINVATGTTQKIKLLKNISEKNVNIEILLRQLVLEKSDIKDIDVNDYKNSDNYLASAKKIIDDLRLRYILQDEVNPLNAEKIIAIGKIRSLYVHECMNKEEHATKIDEENAIKRYEEMVKTFSSLLSPHEHKEFVEQYIIGIRSAEQSEVK